MFKEMRQQYQKVLDRKGIDYIGSSNVLMYAGCLKENTPEALEFALNHWKEQYNKFKPSVRSCALLSCLAMKNDKPDVALDVLSAIPLERVMSIRGLKMLAYVHLGRYIQIIPLLKYGLDQSGIHKKSRYFFADVICELEEKLKTENVEEGKQLLNLIEQARKQDFIQSTYTLEEFILRPIMFATRFKESNSDMEDRRRIRHRYSYKPEEKVELKNYL